MRVVGRGSRDELLLLSGSPPAALHVPRWPLLTSIFSSKHTDSCVLPGEEAGPHSAPVLFPSLLHRMPLQPRSVCLLSSVVCCQLLLFIAHICGSGAHANSRFGLVLFCSLVKTEAFISGSVISSERTTVFV